MGTVTVLNAERMLEIEANSVNLGNLHAGPASMAVFGDSYVDPAPPGSTGKEGIPNLTRQLLRVPYGNYQNMAVSGGMARNNRKESCYRSVWNFFDTKRASAPYTPDCAYALIKFDTNDAIYGVTSQQEYGYVGATRSMIARAQGGSFYAHNDPSVATSGGRELLWNALSAEPYRVSAHSEEFAWGSGSGCILLETAAETITITVPEDHTGFVDLFLIGAYYGGTANVHVNGVLHGTITTGGCGIPWLGSYLTDERNGLVYRISNVPAGAATIVITATAIDAGVTGSTGFIGFDSWSIRAANANLPFIQIPEMALPDGGLSGFWAGVDATDADTYTAWKHALADELNAGLPDGVVAVGVPATRDALFGFDVIVDGEDVDAAGHPPRDACAEFAKIIVEDFARNVSNKRQIGWSTSWETDSDDVTQTPSLLIGTTSPVEVYDNFESAGAPLASPWVSTSGTWLEDSGEAFFNDDFGGGDTWSTVYQDTGVLDCKVTAIQSGDPENNSGIAFRVVDQDNFVSLVQSVLYGNWFYRCYVDGVIVSSGVVVGPHIDGTRVDVVLSGNQAFVYFDGVESASSPINITTNPDGTGAGLHASGTEFSRWSEFAAGIFNDASEGQVYIDTTLGQVWGPYDEGTLSFPGPFPLISDEAWEDRTALNLPAATVLSKLITVDGPGSDLNADKLDGYQATEIIPQSRTFYSGELAASRPTTAHAPQAATGCRTGYWGLVNAADHGVLFGLDIPPGWATINVSVRWTPTNTDTGNVVFEASRVVDADGGNVTTWGSAIVTTTDAADGVANVTQSTTVLSGIAVTPGNHLLLCVERNGDDAADTFTGDVRVVSVTVTKAS